MSNITYHDIDTSRNTFEWVGVAPLVDTDVVVISIHNNFTMVPMVVMGVVSPFMYVNVVVVAVDNNLAMVVIVVMVMMVRFRNG